MWRWNWRRFWRIQLVTFAVLLVAFAVVVMLAFGLSVMSAGPANRSSAADFQSLAAWLIEFPLKPAATPRGNTPIPTLLLTVAANVAAWALGVSAAWSSLFTALLGLMGRGRPTANG
jgi:hypothetical protein